MPEHLEISALHKREYGEQPGVVVSAPGSVNLMGEHTESSEGYVLGFALDREVQVAVSRRPDNALRFYSADSGEGERKKTTLANLKYKREDRWANYPKGVLASLLNLGFEFSGLNWTVQSRIPAEKGLAASAAITSATAAAAARIFGLDITQGRLIEAARMAEDRFMGKPCGLSDYMISFLAEPGKALFVDTRSLDYSYVPLPGEAAFLVTDSRVPKAFREEDYPGYRESRRECLEVLKSRRNGSTLRDYRERDLRETMGRTSGPSPRRCLHVVQENRRVWELKEALEQDRLAAAGKLMFRSHESLRNLYEVTCPELDWLVKRAQETEGVYGSRMIGEGYGGCTLTCLAPAAAAAYEEHLEDYDRIFGFKADHFFCRPAGGVQVLVSPESGQLSQGEGGHSREG